MRCGNIIMVLSIVQKHWFLIGILLAILLAKLQPWIGSKNGLLHPELTVKYIAVSVIFFNSGLSLKTEDLASAIFQLNLHLYIQLFTFVLAPVTMYLVSSVLQASPFDKLLLQGLVVLGCMPPPVSSAVILTKAVGGNEAGAIFNSAFGSFLGIIITPIWLLYFVGSSTEISKLSVFLQLSMTVVVPLIFGQIVRSWAHRTITRANIPFGSISSAVLLLIIYTTFCDTFSHDIQLDAVSLFSIVSLIILLQCMLLVLTFYLSTRSVWKFSPSDVVACIFCSTHKSLTLGIPILKVLFSDNPQISVISIPLLVYHPTQILLGGLLVPFVRGWMMESIRKSRSNSINYV